MSFLRWMCEGGNLLLQKPTNSPPLTIMFTWVAGFLLHLEFFSQGLELGATFLKVLVLVIAGGSGRQQTDIAGLGVC